MLILAGVDDVMVGDGSDVMWYSGVGLAQTLTGGSSHCS